jgi:hypothetical protein
MALKTATVKINRQEARFLLNGAREYLGQIVAEYDGREAFIVLIDKAKADVVKWQAVLDNFDEGRKPVLWRNIK